MRTSLLGCGKDADSLFFETNLLGRLWRATEQYLQKGFFYILVFYFQ